MPDPPERQSAQAPAQSNSDIVREITGALARGDLLVVMSKLSKDIRWAVNAADRESAPWFRVYEGRKNLPDFFSELAKVEFSDFTLKAVASDGDVVITWLHVAFTGPSGRSVDMEETQIWRFENGKVRSVDTLLDTAAVAAVFGP
ncbi:MAG TPA: nuclear transport factor 2 family protein [Acidimicrobiales bacterium]|nr:nuclear transport factor 2 family protein [Acidimicrobiales bacterium]